MNNGNCRQSHRHRPLHAEAGSSGAPKKHSNIAGDVNTSEEPPAITLKTSPCFILGVRDSVRDGPDEDDLATIMATDTCNLVAAEPPETLISIDLDALLTDDARKLEFLRVRSCLPAPLCSPSHKNRLWGAWRGTSRFDNDRNKCDPPLFITIHPNHKKRWVVPIGLQPGARHVRMGADGIPMAKGSRSC